MSHIIPTHEETRLTDRVIKEGEPMSEKCNVDDILCKMGVLQNLRGLQKGMGDETFLKEFPELQGMDEKLTAKIESSTLAVSEALAECGQTAPEETIEEVIVKPLGIVSIEERPEEVPEEK